MVIHRALSGIVIGGILVLLLVSTGTAQPGSTAPAPAHQPAPPPEGATAPLTTTYTFSQTTSADWASGTAYQIDRRTLDALHTPYAWGDDPRGSVRLASRPADFARQSLFPVLPRGGDGAWDERNVAEAAVIYDGSEYKMWYSGQNDANEWQVGLATSPDGVTWTRDENNPVLAVRPGEWDSQEASFSCVLDDGTSYHTWYSGYDGSQRQIGYASSIDGVHWLRADEPVLRSGDPGSWDETLVGNPTVLHDGIRYHMWYGGWSSTDPHWRIGHATSTDLSTWEKDPAKPVLDLGPVDGWDDSHVSAPAVLYDGHNFHMWYTGWGDEEYGEHSPGQIGYATSLDGSTWFRDTGDNPVFGPSSPGDWDSMWTVDPEVIFDGDEYQLWYTGGVTWTGIQIGSATAPPSYATSGHYTSPPISTTCPTGTTLLRGTLEVEQAPNGQTLTYTLLDDAGQPITGFAGLSSPNPQATFHLYLLAGRHERIYLRADLATTDSTSSPVLEAWTLTWSCQTLTHHIYMPLIER